MFEVMVFAFSIFEALLLFFMLKPPLVNLKPSLEFQGHKLEGKRPFWLLNALNV